MIDKLFWRLIVWSLAGLFALAQAQSMQLPVSSYLLMDAQSGQVLLAGNADQRLPPASITKLMTAYLTFAALEEKRITMDTLVSVSENAYRQPGSRMFIEINKQIPVSELIQGVIIQSGNDASVALAEYLGGSVQGFAQMMNKTAQKLGMHNTHYVNPTGLPDPNHYTTAKDIAILSRQIILQYPQYYHYYSQHSFSHNNITQQNRNQLLYRNANIDGLKTGHTTEAGFCLASSEKRGDMRLIAVVLGAEIEEDRYSASQTLFNAGFAQFARVTALNTETILSQVPVFKGATDSVGVRAAQTVKILIPVAQKGNVRASLNLNRALAPLSIGDKLGTITISVGDKIYATTDAVAAETIASAGFFKRQWHNIKLLFAD